MRQTPAAAPRRFPWLAAATGLLGLAWGLRLLRLDFQPLWFDEGYSVYFASLPPLDGLAATAADIHPPLYYLLLAAWFAAFGRNALTARLLSVFIGLATVALVYVLGARLLNRAAGLLAAALLAFSPFHIFYSQEVRMYALVTLLATAATLAGTRAAFAPAKERRPVGVWAAYSGLVTLAALTQYYAVFLPLGHGLWLLFARRRAFRAWLLAALASAALYLPWLLYAVGQLTTYVTGKVAAEGYAPLGPLAFLGSVLAAYTVGAAQPLALGLFGVAALALVFVRGPGAGGRGRAITLALFRGGRGPDPGPRTFLAVSLAAILAGAFLVNLRFPFHPVQWERLVLFGLPFFLLLVAGGLGRLFTWRPAAGAALLALLALPALAALGRFYATPRYAADDYRPVAARVAALARPADAVIAVYPWQIGFFQAYLPAPAPELALVPATAWAEDRARRDADLATLAAAHPRLWFPAFQIFGRRLENDVETQLAGTAYPALNEWYGNTRLLAYGTARPDGSGPGADFGGRLRLEAAAFGPATVESGAGAVNLALRWTATAPPERYTVHLRLADAAGRTWAQRDSEPAGGLRPSTDWHTDTAVEDHHALLVPAGTPPGEYALRLAVSGPGGDLDRRENGVPKGPELTLGSVRVTPATFRPRTEALPIAHRLDPPAALGPDITLLGYSLGADALQTGARQRLSLFFRAERRPAADRPVVVALVQEGGGARAERSFPAVDGRYPLTAWPGGAAVHDQLDFLVPPDLPAGAYRLEVRLGEGPSVRLAPVRVTAREHRFDRPAPRNATTFRLGTLAELVGYDLARGPETVELTLHWRAVSGTEQDYTAFVHLLDGAGTVVAQVDHVPGAGAFPTPSWVPGEYLRDSYQLPIPVGFTGGVLEVGLYDPASGVRLPAADAAGRSVGDSVMLARLEAR